MQRVPLVLRDTVQTVGGRRDHREGRTWWSGRADATWQSRRYVPVMNMRQVFAVLGPILAGTAIGINASSVGYGNAVFGVVVGLGVGLTLAAFVPDRR